MGVSGGKSFEGRFRNQKRYPAVGQAGCQPPGPTPSRTFPKVRHFYKVRTITVYYGLWQTRFRLDRVHKGSSCGELGHMAHLYPLQPAHCPHQVRVRSENDLYRDNDSLGSDPVAPAHRALSLQDYSFRLSYRGTSSGSTAG